MRKSSFKWLASLACFTFGTLCADDYYIKVATESGTFVPLCDCTDSGNSCCTFLTGINTANGLGSAATLHITPATITYTGPAMDPCISQGTITIEPVTVGSGGTVIDFAGQGSSGCSTSSIFQLTYTDGSNPGSVTLNDTVFQNSTGSSIITIAGGTLTTNGTTNSGSNTFTGNEWDVSVNNAHQPSLTFGPLATGNTYTAPFPGNIVFTVNDTHLTVTNNDTAPVTISGDIGPSDEVTGSRFDLLSNTGAFTLSGKVTVETLRGLNPSDITLTGTSNEIPTINLNFFSNLSITSSSNLGTATALNMFGGNTLNYNAALTLPEAMTIWLRGNQQTFDDHGNNIVIDALVSADGINSHDHRYFKAGSGMQTLTNGNNATNFRDWPVIIYDGVFQVTQTGAYGGGGIYLEGGTFYVSGDNVLVGYSRRLAVGAGGALAVQAGRTFIMQHNPEGSGPLTIGSPIASLNASGTVLLRNVGATNFTGDLFIGALDSSNNSYPAVLSMGLTPLAFSAQLGKVHSITLQGGGSWVTTLDMTAVNLLSVNVPIYVNTGSGSINPNVGTTFTIPGPLAVTGGAVGSIVLTVGGGGTVVLSGDNSGYTGGFSVVNGSTLIVSDPTNIGGASGVTLSTAGILEASATMNLGSTPIQVGAGSGFVKADVGTTLTVPNTFSVVSGTKGDVLLTFGGGGTVALTGNNSDYKGGFAVTDTTTLSISETTNIPSSGLLSFPTAGCTLEKTGSGTVTILPKKAASNASFTVDITGGTFTSNAEFLSGATIAVADSCAIDFNQKGNGTFSGDITGAGILIKDGHGTLHLTGNLSYTGLTYVNAGKLVVTGSITSSPDPTVLAGAILSGTGSVNDTTVQSGGTVKGGDPFGTLTIAGFLLLETGSNFETGLSLTDTTLVTVTEAVTIEPGTFYALSLEPGFYTSTPRVVLIGDSITGEFASVKFVDSSPFITTTLQYTGTEVILTLQSIAISPLAKGGNAVRVADVLDGIIVSMTPGIDPMIASLTSFDTEAEMTNALNQLHPAQEKGLAISQENNALRVRQAVSQRMADELNMENCFLSNRQDADGKRCCDKHEKRVTVWASGIGDTLVQDDVANFWGPIAGYRVNTGGVVVGIDRVIAEHFYLGALGAYTHSHLHYHADKGTGSISSGYMGLYFSALGSGSIGKMFYVNASVVGSWNEYRGDRHIEYPGVNLTAKSHHFGSQVLSHLDTGININCFDVTVRPFDSFDYMSQSEGKYAEHNAGAWELALGKKNEIMLRNELGLQFAKCLCFCGSKWIFSPKISWVREVRVKGDTFNTRFRGAGPTFAIQGYFPDRSLIAPGMAITGVLLDDMLKVDLYYDGEFKGNYSSNSVGGQVSYSF